MSQNSIKVTKSFLPPISEYINLLRSVWDCGQLTNYGPLHQELESRLNEYLGAKHLLIVNNGTIALQIAIRALGLSGKIITTPFSYVATTSTIAWERCVPVFADIEEDTLCIDPQKIERLITKETSAIVATHVYGNQCDVEAIEEIAKKYSLKVIYDAAHAFGVRYKETSLLSWGDASTLSFHATKLFHTGEGGAVVCTSNRVAKRVEYMRNFGHKGYEDFQGLGINGKLSDLHAAMGLTVLPYVDEMIKRRKIATEYYDRLFLDSSLIRPRIRDIEGYNYSYYPVIFPTIEALKLAIDILNKENIFPRRYFYPSLSTLPYVKDADTQIANRISKKVLCLPFWDGIDIATQTQIASLIQSVL